MQIRPVPCLSDNYAYLVWRDDGRDAIVVDPSEAAPVAKALEREGLRLRAVLCTHHHWDHVGGNETLAKSWPGLSVYGHASDVGRIPAQTESLEDGARFECAGLQLRVIHIPGHTLGAIAYVVDAAVFTGDTLFAAGCGRLFEGTPAMMYASLNDKLGALVDDTRVYCGHEYTQSNLRFAAHVEPGNAAVRDKLRQVAELRARGEPTVPSTIGQERLTNPFMRCQSAEIIASVAQRLGNDHGPVAVLAAVREAKDAFR